MSDPGYSIEMTAERVAVLRLSFAKANSMSPDMLLALRAALAESMAQGASAVVLTGARRSFCAGLALPEIVGLDREAMADFMTSFSDAMRELLMLPVPTVAAINGHAIAGGTVMALMCDYRIMTDGDALIGLNEAQLGIGLPAIVIEPLRARVPSRSWAPIALAGELFEPAEALALGLVDDVTEADDLLDLAIVRATELAKSPEAYAQVKAALLRPTVAELDAVGPAELQAWLDTWFSPSGQRLVTATVAKLTGFVG